MPAYEYRCGACELVFELRRPMSESGDPATCPTGHEGARRVMSVFASVGDGPEPQGPAGGGCGGACACHPG